jgi:hypothetical protein
MAGVVVGRCSGRQAGVVAGWQAGVLAGGCGSRLAGGCGSRLAGGCGGSYRRPSTAWMVNKNKIYFWWIYFYT